MQDYVTLELMKSASSADADRNLWALSHVKDQPWQHYLQWLIIQNIESAAQDEERAMKSDWVY